MKRNHDYGLGSALILLLSVLFLCWFRIEEGFDQPYYFVADQDVTLVSQAMALDDGLRQQFDNHPGYGIIQALRAWFRLEIALGFMEPPTLETISAPGSLAATLTQPVIAGRHLSLLIAICTALLSSGVVLVLTDRKEIALISALFYCTTIGMFFQTMFIRTELLSHFFLVLSFFFAASQARNPLSGKSHLAFASGIALYLAMVTKIQVILIAPFMAPLLTLCQRPGRIAWWFAEPEPSQVKKTAFLYFPVATGIVTLLAMLYEMPRSFILIPHSALILGLLLCWAFHVVWTRQAALSILPSALSFLGGMGVGYLTTFINYNPGNHFAILNFVDGLTAHCVSDSCQSRNYAEVFYALYNQIFATLNAKLEWSWITERPAVIFFWVTLAAILIQFRIRRTWQSYAASLLFIGAFVLETIFRMRWAESTDHSIVVYYVLYTDYFEILALSLSLTPLVSENTFYGRMIVSVALVLSAVSATRNMEAARRDRFVGVSTRQKIENQCIYLGYSPPLARAMNKIGPCETMVYTDYAAYLKNFEKRKPGQ